MSSNTIRATGRIPRTPDLLRATFCTRSQSPSSLRLTEREFGGSWVTAQSAISRLKRAVKPQALTVPTKLGATITPNLKPSTDGTDACFKLCHSPSEPGTACTLALTSSHLIICRPSRVFLVPRCVAFDTHDRMVRESWIMPNAGERRVRFDIGIKKRSC